MEEKTRRYYQGSAHPFAAFVTNLGKYNEGTLDGKWVTFPTTKEAVEDVLYHIGIGRQNESGTSYEEWFIADYEWHVTPRRPDFLGEHESLDELNYLAMKLQEMDECDYEKFQVAEQLGDHGGSLKDLINLAGNLERYEVLPEIEDDDDLGRWCVETFHQGGVSEALREYLDYEGIGRDFGINNAGAHTEQGYAFCNRRAKFVEEYDGGREGIPEECRVVPERGRSSGKAAPSVPDAAMAMRGQARKNASRRMEHVVPFLAR